MIPEFSRKGSLLGIDFDPDNMPEELEVRPGKMLGDNYVRTAQMIHIEDAIDRFKGPVLIVQGNNDYPELMESARYAAKRYKNCTYVEIDGSTHCYDGHLPEMEKAIKDWLPKA